MKTQTLSHSPKPLRISPAEEEKILRQFEAYVATYPVKQAEKEQNPGTNIPAAQHFEN